MSIRTGRGSDQFVVRLPPGMRDKIAAAAAETGRSMNSEIVERLEHSFGEGSVENIEEAKRVITSAREELNRSTEIMSRQNKIIENFPSLIEELLVKAVNNIASREKNKE
jgi:hypothetical protein